MSLPRLPISAFFITFNEADRLPQALAPVTALCAEIIVIDSGSTDETRAIAEGMGARVVLNAPFPGYGPQKRFGEDQASQPWLLNLDADEELSEEAVTAIRALFATGAPDCDAVRFAIREMYPGEARPSRFAYTLHKIRLYRRERGRFDASPVFDDVRMEEKSRVVSITGDIRHRSFRSIRDVSRKFDALNDVQVADLIARGRKPSRWRLVIEFPMQFLKVYFGRRHFLRGTYGFLIAMNHAWFRYMRLAKWIERSGLAGNR